MCIVLTKLMIKQNWYLKLVFMIPIANSAIFGEKCCSYEAYTQSSLIKRSGYYRGSEKY